MPANIPESFDAVVVGSGFGGAVMAFELANAGFEVCLLERGKRYATHGFPRSPYDLGRNVWDPSEGRYGMFDIWSFRQSEAVVASGLGGGSLIYANVLLRMPEDWFADPVDLSPWPVAYADLAIHYDAVEQVLGAAPFPSVPPYSDTPKVVAFRQAGAELASRHAGSVADQPLKLAVAFSPKPNSPAAKAVPIPITTDLHGGVRLTCRLCGECNVGCNSGSKNSVDYNYLSRAEWTGRCQIRDLCEVKEIRPKGGPGTGYVVEYVKHDPHRWEDRRWPKGRTRKTHTIIAKRLILCAGTLGSTYLLLKNRGHFPGISRTLGSRYSTNGDLLTFALNCHDRSGPIPVPRNIHPSTGPVISSCIRVDQGPGRGFFLQDAGYPEFVGWLVETADASNWFVGLQRFLVDRAAQLLLGEPRSDIDGRLSRMLGTGRLSARSMPLLAMGRDNPSGRMYLRWSARSTNPYLQVDWKRQHSASYFRAVTDVSREFASALGGDFRENPGYQFLQRVVTVHPLGGCPMGHHPGDGVVDAQGQVFGYPDLYVADGSVLPGPTGANPSLTIAALSRRIAHRIQERAF